MKIPQDGLPDHLFKYVSSITPIINVDLIIHNPKKGIILSWRSDNFYGPGWHVPGGIIRFKESIVDRLYHVARQELNMYQDLEFSFISINQIMNPNRDIRGHFISLLFACELDNPHIDNKNYEENKNGFFRWHEKLPNNIIKQHKRYEKHMKRYIYKSNEKVFDFGNIMGEYSSYDEK